MIITHKDALIVVILHFNSFNFYNCKTTPSVSAYRQAGFGLFLMIEEKLRFFANVFNIHDKAQNHNLTKAYLSVFKCI